MSLVGFDAKNHPQQTARRGALHSVDDRATEPGFFGALDQRFDFTIDVAASSDNTKLPRFFDEDMNGLLQPWDGERVWCNPPYSNIEPWVEKAWQESGTPLLVMLLPANRTEQAWWQDLIEPFRDRPGSPLTTEFIRGRLRFIAPGASRIGPNERPPFGVVLAIWDRMGPFVVPTHQESLDLNRGG